MLESMTGFGRGTARVEQTEVTVELRSVNGRFCE
ncbi:MAG: YicC/YloC family endoribonuclease, partial [Bacteroidota bacterium]